MVWISLVCMFTKEERHKRVILRDRIMRKLILKWLFDNELKDYWDLLKENIKIRDNHIKTLEEYSKTLTQMRQLIDLCIKHGIDVDEELEV